MTEANESLLLRPAREADLEFLLDLRKTTMSDHLRNSGVDPSESERIKRVRARYECAKIIVLSDRPVGLLKVARDGKQWTLIQIQLVPDRQGKGLGTGIVKAVMDDAARCGASIELSVLRANPARRLYERLGFRIVRESLHAYEMRLGA